MLLHENINLFGNLHLRENWKIKSFFLLYIKNKIKTFIFLLEEEI